MNDAEKHVTVAVEGVIDAVVAQRIVTFAGLRLARAPLISGGKQKLDRQLRGYNNASKHSSWLVLRDMDHDAPCATALCRQLVPEPSQGLILRIAVRAIESWLIADRPGLAHYLRVPVGSVPLDPERLSSPKDSIIRLAKRSKSEALRRSLVPMKGSIARVGPGYTGRISEFALTAWDPAAAVECSRSLARTILRLKSIVE